MNEMHEMNPESDLSNRERQEQLHILIKQRQRINVAQICEHFGVSEATARRDLNALAQMGAIRRFHGGGADIFRAPPEPPIIERSAEQLGIKQRIGRLAASLVNDGETILLGSGTTVLEVARNLKEYSLTVITNSMLVVNMLSDAPGISLIGLGGVFRQTEQSFIGDITIQGLAELRADKVFMGVRAVDPDAGLTNDHVPETGTARAILNAGREVIIVADHTKCGRISTAYVASSMVMSTLVTNHEISDEYVKAFAVKGVRVLTA